MINKSKSYLLPLLSEEVQLSYFELLKNSYVFIDGYEGENLGLLYKFDSEYTYFKDKVQGFIIYEEYLIHHPLFIDKIDSKDDVLYIFKFPEKYMHEYRLFIDGKYSLFRENNKVKILNYLELKFGKENSPIINYIGGVLSKDDTVRGYIEENLDIVLPKDSELSSKIDVELETFKTVIGNE